MAAKKTSQTKHKLGRNVGKTLRGGYKKENPNKIKKAADRLLKLSNKLQVLNKSNTRAKKAAFCDLSVMELDDLGVSWVKRCSSRSNIGEKVYTTRSRKGFISEESKARTKETERVKKTFLSRERNTKLDSVEMQSRNKSNDDLRHQSTSSVDMSSYNWKPTDIKDKIPHGKELESATSKLVLPRSKISKQVNCENEEKFSKVRTSERRKIEDSNVDQTPSLAYIHVGDGGEADLKAHLEGSTKIAIQILEEERLPDIYYGEVVSGQDRHGTSRDLVDGGHQCGVRCPVGCQGHLRPNELVIYHSYKENEMLVDRKRIKARFVHREKGDLHVKPGDEPPVLASLCMDSFKRISGRRSRRETGNRETVMRRRLAAQERFATAMRADRNDSPIPFLPSMLGPSMPQIVSALLLRPPVSLAMSEEHGWNNQDRSRNVVLKSEDVLTMRRRPVAMSTDGVRARVGYSEGVHVFLVTWPKHQRGTHAMVGVATRQELVQRPGYGSLLGETLNSWGWDLGRKKAVHCGRDAQPNSLYPASLTHHHQWSVPDSFYMVLDMDQGTLAWVAQHQYLGVSHTGLSGRVFPMVSSVWGHCEVTLRYLGSSDSHTVFSLKELAKVEVRRALGSSTESIDFELDLGLPKELARYLDKGD